MLSNAISFMPELIGYELGIYPEVINWEEMLTTFSFSPETTKAQ